MIDLNSPIVTESITDLVNKIDNLSIFKKYINDFTIGKPIHSPLRKDNIPSFAIFFGQREQKYMFKDFATGETGDAIKFKSLLFNISYKQALYSEFLDTNNTIPLKTNSTSDSPVQRPSKVDIKIKKRPYQKYDLKYFSQFNITKNILEQYKVFAVKYLFFNDYIFSTDKHCYAFLEYKDDKVTFKIYQPFNKKYKFMNNHDFSVWQGWRQLPDKGEHLIITSSLKDVMSIVNTIGIPSVSLQSETTLPKDKIIQELKDRFAIITVLYDTDSAGLKYGKQLSDYYNIGFKAIDSKFNAKDPSDLIKKIGKTEAANYLKKLIL